MEYTTLVDSPEYFGLKTINLSSPALEEAAFLIEVKNALGAQAKFVLPDGKGYDLSTGQKSDNFKNFTFASLQKAVDWYNQSQVNHKAFVAQPDFSHS